jgi:HK97 family phage major capsid protein
MENIVITPDQLKMVVETKANEKAQDILRNANPTHVTGFVKIKADHDARRDQARVISDYINAKHKGDHAGAESIARDANNKYVTRANFNTGTAAQGGAVVPAFWVEEIMNFADRFGYARALAKIYPMRGNKEYLASSGNFTAAVVAEGSGLTVTDSANFFTQTTLQSQKVVGGAILSIEQLEDATPAFLDYVTNGLGRAIAGKEDEQFFNGNGTAPNFTGALNISGSTVTYLGGASNSGKTGFSAISWTDLINLRLSLNSTVGANGVFVVPQSVFGHIIKEMDQQDRPIWNQLQPMDIPAIGLTALEGNTYVTPFGRPMHVVPDSLFPTSAANKGCALYADFAQFSILGIREDIMVNEYKEYFGATGLGGTHQKGIEVVERIGIAFPAPTAIGVLKTSAT